MYTQSFDAMETPSDVPAWVVVILLATLVLTWAVVTFGIDAGVTPVRPMVSDVPVSTEIS